MQIQFPDHTGEGWQDLDGTPEGAKPLEGDDALFLSNVDEDPGEPKNLRHRNPAMLDELLTMAEKWLEDVKKP